MMLKLLFRRIICKNCSFDLNNYFIYQPDSWDEDEDGIWKPPKVPNPAYKGPWKRKVCFSIYQDNFSFYHILVRLEHMFIKFLMHCTCRKLRILTTRVNGRSHGLITQVSVVMLFRQVLCLFVAY